MRLNNIALPHPVLGRLDDIVGSSSLQDTNIDIKDHAYSINFNIDHENGTISDLVKLEKALYCCEVTCSGTLFREIFTSSVPRFEFDIKRTSLRNKVDFQVYCLASNAIPNYSNPAAHNDYAGFSFELEKADLLANFGSFTFNADVQYHKLKAASSFMEIIPHQGDEKYTDYILDSKKIQIKLPKEIYEKYKQDYIGKKKEFAAIIHASLVQNALTVALYRYKEYLDMGDCVWAESIQYRLRDERYLNNGSEIIDPDKIPELVQKLLGNPNKRLINCLEELSNVKEAD